jgi:hypothetical protein
MEFGIVIIVFLQRMVIYCAVVRLQWSVGVSQHGEDGARDVRKAEARGGRARIGNKGAWVGG